MRADYHLHCEFSDDSRERMETQIERAIELKLDEICFTDHVDYGIKKDWEIDRMQETYRGQIVIKKGLEFGIQTITANQFQKLYDRYKNELDFVLFSMHQVNNLEFWTQDFQRGKTQKEYNEEYYREIYETMKIYKDYSCLAHLDLIVRYDKHGRFPFEETEDIIAEILKLAIHDGKGIEINTSSWHYGLTDTQPSREILRLYKDLGGTILTTGSDAHKPEYLADHFTEAHQILRSIGFREFSTFDHMEPIFHPLEG